MQKHKKFKYLLYFIKKELKIDQYNELILNEIIKFLNNSGNFYWKWDDNMLNP